MAHFTAVLEIIEVKETGIVTNLTKDKTELARIVVRADSVEKLRDKLASHVALIES